MSRRCRGPTGRRHTGHNVMSRRRCGTTWQWYAGRNVMSRRRRGTTWQWYAGRNVVGRGEAFASHDPGKNTSCVRECFAPTASHRGPRCGRGRHRIVDRGVVVDDIASWTAVWSWTTSHRGPRCGRGRHCIVERGVVVDDIASWNAVWSWTATPSSITMGAHKDTARAIAGGVSWTNDGSYRATRLRDTAPAPISAAAASAIRPSGRLSPEVRGNWPGRVAIPPGTV
jgi:hypothetical protein